MGRVARVSPGALLGVALVGLAPRRAGVLASWAVVVLAAGVLSAVPWLHETYPQGISFGLATVLVGLASLRRSSEVAAHRAHG